MSKDNKLQLVAQFLMDMDYTNPTNGATVVDIAERVGLARSTLYRVIESTTAKKWGIFKTAKKIQPYSYYVDTGTLVAYQTQNANSLGVNAPIMFHDPDRQLVLEMMFKLLVKAVANIQRVDYVKDNFARMIVEQQEQVIFEQWPKLAPGGKVLNGLLLAFQNIKE